MTGKNSGVPAGIVSSMVTAPPYDGRQEQDAILSPKCSAGNDWVVAVHDRKRERCLPPPRSPLAVGQAPILAWGGITPGFPLPPGLGVVRDGRQSDQDQQHS